ncbi:hypothetical protein F750_0159 [Streptomyces sp. PAMC 26508]|nr:hypothetical protein F750_0159 [Streptomyces sp. PAMC 26508]
MLGEGTGRDEPDAAARTPVTTAVRPVGSGRSARENLDTPQK